MCPVGLVRINASRAVLSSSLMNESIEFSNCARVIIARQQQRSELNRKERQERRSCFSSTYLQIYSWGFVLPGCLSEMLHVLHKYIRNWTSSSTGFKQWTGMWVLPTGFGMVSLRGKVLPSRSVDGRSLIMLLIIHFNSVLDLHRTNIYPYKKQMVHRNPLSRLKLV